MKTTSNKKYIAALLILLVGVLVGWLISPSPGSSSNATDQHLHADEDQVWTCSMHPQIRSNEAGQCPICGMDLIPVQQNVGQESNPYVHTMSPEAVALANIQTEIVIMSQPNQQLTLSGKIAVNEQSLAVIPSNYAGRIDRLFVDVTGQAVQAGQRIATIYSPELITAQQELLEVAKTKDSNLALYNAARQKLLNWKLSKSQIDNIEERGQVKSQFDVLANESGVVLSKLVLEGDYVSRGQALFEVAKLSTVWVMLDAYETDFSLINKGSTITFTVPSIPGKTFTAVVDFIDPVLDPQTRTAAVRAVVPNRDMNLKPEMFVNATIASTPGSQQEALLIPKTAVLWTGKRSIAYVKLPDTAMPSFEMREITLGANTGDHYIIESGLEPGEEVVKNGAFAIDAASQLNGGYSMMNRPASVEVEVPPALQKQLNAMTEIYFQLKNELVESDAQKAISEADKLAGHLARLELDALPEDAKASGKAEAEKMKQAIEAIRKSKDIEMQRASFITLSDGMINLLKKYQFSDSKLFVDFCPMANNDKGAYWLSEIEEIRNPYFGDAMLSCGEIKEVVRPASPAIRSAPAQQHVH